jgi:Plasmid pRiA4b ORF-3-like protein
MSLLKFKVYWDEDSDIFRDIEIMSGQTFYELHQCIKKNSMFLCDERYFKGKEISSIVEKNLRDAPALSMKKTPIGALLSDPYQKFVYVCDNEKHWQFFLDMITFKPDHPDINLFPRCVKSEGLSPSQFGIGMGGSKNVVVEVEERYDLASTDGFGDEGEDDPATESNEEAADDNFTEDL